MEGSSRERLQLPTMRRRALQRRSGFSCEEQLVALYAVWSALHSYRRRWQRQVWQWKVVIRGAQVHSWVLYPNPYKTYHYGCTMISLFCSNTHDPVVKNIIFKRTAITENTILSNLAVKNLFYFQIIHIANVF